ncbi:carboxyl-terminal processing protease [Zhouia amylolytica]|uniref:C-terminal processing peptidase n=2 Tax=Zhouia amylolytica TaxID=376730 RepID=W2UJV1_9FLAO|nr:S41 family peptidase [Zhouia amylolytica]ETN94244.1 C-terminal processing peptidase [Zhouia amylolytica AD3]MCQ0111459.1 S41 family peptidase [Zhouia amylolytica]SFS39013.1 carboxyl-terminal processing protease [Zhouia amylolytica]
MLKGKNYIWPVIILGALALGVFIGGKLHFNDTPEKLFTTNSKKDKLNRLIDYIDFEYVDEVNTDSIVDVTVNNILDKLDPHSVYIPKEQAKRAAESMKGDFVGVGVSFYMYKDSLTVIRPIKGGPSYKAGVKPGDRILFANGDTLFGKKLASEEIINKLQGARNTPVNLKIFRKGEEGLLDVKIKRAEVPLPSVDAYYMLSDSLGYIKINRFAESTYQEFKIGLNALLEEGMTALTLDLRDNPGGYMGIAEEIIDEFLESRKLIVFTKNKSGAIQKSYATKKGDFEDGHVYVLINEKSASASEIVAGALQDNDKGTIVGRRSFGKGLVQREMGLGDGSSVRLTVSRYYTPTGRSIQRSYENGTKDYYDNFYERYRNGELKNQDSIKVADSLIFKTPKGKIVYGGGGIIPDVFVPINGTYKDESLDVLLKSDFTSFFAFELLDKDRNAYSDYDADSFIDEVVITDQTVEDFINYSRNDRGLNIDLNPYKKAMKKYIKAAIAEQLYGPNIKEQILNQDDHMLKKVIELSNSDSEDVNQEE